MHKSMLRSGPFRLLLTTIVGLLMFQQQATALTPQMRQAKSGAFYRVLPQGRNSIAFTSRRPAKSESRIQLCIPAAFTTHGGTIDGAYMIDGRAVNSRQINRELGGALLFINGSCKAIATESGARLTEDFISRIGKLNGSFFQQFLIVHNAQPASFKDKSKFQRRAIVELKDGTTAIIESVAPMQFAKFNNDLVDLGAREAIYTDMGAWDEGWYRDDRSNIVQLGLDRSRTRDQSNWVIFIDNGAVPRKFDYGF